MDHDSIKQSLIETNETFRKLFEEHQQCEGKLDALHQKADPSLDDEIEAKKIKVHKLALKDQMESMIRAQAAN